MANACKYFVLESLFTSCTCKWHVFIMLQVKVWK